ncbi:MAG: iron ABC transporter permease [Cyclobacteriaceae bacterium]
MIRQQLDTSITKWRMTFIGLFVAMIVVFVMSLLLGSVSIPLNQTLKFLGGGTLDNSGWQAILMNFRLPKAMTSILVGSALGVSGLQMQTLFRNPLAGPFILGISSGAGLGVALVIFLGISFGVYFGLPDTARNWLLVISAAGGSFLVLSIIGLAAIRVRSAVTLLIIGLMFGSLVSAVVSIMQFFSQAENIQAYIIWSFGSLGSLSWSELWILIPIVSGGLVVSFALSKNLNALLLGENYAASMGLNLRSIRLVIILCTSLLAGSVTAFCGPIAFVGLAIPHLARMLFNTSNHLLLTPLVILLGAIAMLVFDLIAQLPGSDATLPINAVTSLLGAPFVIWLILRKNNLHYSFEK